jgi:hypothetical protein
VKRGEEKKAAKRRENKIVELRVVIVGAKRKE